MTAPDHGTYAVRLQRRTPAEQLRYLADRLSPEGRAPSATELAAVTHLLAELAGQVRDVCRAVVDRVLEVGAPVLRDHWLSGGALHELVFTDREARPAKWRTRCGREDVPLERTTSPDPAGYYQVDCPACLRVAELEARLAEVRRIAESLGDRSKPADYLPPFDPNQRASERPPTDRRLMEPLKAMLLDVLDRP